ncbi:MAG: hypothetical protein AABX93_00240 [Nanoarchaeota archaeon]
MPNYKSAQVADTATWIIATVVIIFILMISVYAASKIGRTSGLFGDNINQEILAEQSFQAYLLTKDSEGANFYNKISSSGKINSADELIATTLFGKIYGIANSEILFKLTDKKKESIGNLIVQSVNLDRNNLIELTIKSKTAEEKLPWE